MATAAVARLREHFATGATRSVDWRIRQLRQLQRLVSENEPALAAALKTDLGKPEIESEITDISTVAFALSHVRSWAKPERVASRGIAAPSFSTVERIPRGVVLVASPCVVFSVAQVVEGGHSTRSFNYPVSLALGPLVGALAAGNCALLKPSELCPTVSAEFARLVPLYFEPGVVAVVEGGVAEMTALLKERWGLVFFTGSERVGKIVATACAATLTPMVLELGGKCPVVVDWDHPDLRVAARRVVWAKTLNAGQTCLAPDFLVCDEAVVDEFTRLLREAVVEMFGEDPAASRSYSRMCQEAHADRLRTWVAEAEAAGATVVCGGSARCDAAQKKYVPPTILRFDNDQCRHLTEEDDDKKRRPAVLSEEIFGPVLIVLPARSREAAVAIVRAVSGDRTPLCLYVFTANALAARFFADEIRSGAVARNDCIIHFINPHLPFGGLGTSGFGSAHGRHSFECFSHQRAIVHKPCFAEFGNIRYAPYDKYGGYSGWAFATLARVLPDIPVLPRLQTLLLLLLLAVLVVALALAFRSAAATDALARLAPSLVAATCPS